jgi:hypothetical protein
VQGFTGALSPITVESIAGQFDVQGGDGNGTATGLDALATVNGEALTGAGNRFAIDSESGQFELEFQAGFSGSFDPVTVRSAVGFDVEGGDGDGRAVGADGVAVINGRQIVGVQNRFALNGRHGSFTIEFAQGFTGGFDSITVTSRDQRLHASGGRLGTTIRGHDARATINGEARTGDATRFMVEDNGVVASIEFATGFIGRFEPVTIASRTADSGFGQSSAGQATSSGGESDSTMSATSGFSVTELTSRFLSSLARNAPELLLETIGFGGQDNQKRRQLIAELLR